MGNKQSAFLPNGPHDHRFLIFSFAGDEGRLPFSIAFHKNESGKRNFFKVMEPDLQRRSRAQEWIGALPGMTLDTFLKITNKASENLPANQDPTDKCGCRWWAYNVLMEMKRGNHVNPETQSGEVADPELLYVEICTSSPTEINKPAYTSF